MEGIYLHVLMCFRMLYEIKKKKKHQTHKALLPKPNKTQKLPLLQVIFKILLRFICIFKHLMVVKNLDLKPQLTKSLGWEYVMSFVGKETGILLLLDK